MTKHSSRRKGGSTTADIILFVILSLYAASMVVLIGWAVITSFKSQTDFRLNIVGLPEKWVWNYGIVFKQFKYTVFFEGVGNRYIGVGEMLVNTLLYAGGCAVTQTVTPCIVAYCCARYRYKMSKVIPYVVIIVMTLPIVGSLPSEIRMAKIFGLYDQIWGLWIMKCNFLGVYFLVFLGSFKSIPKSLGESAKIDGAGDMTIMVRVIIPTVMPTVCTILLLNFIGFWNDYTVPLVYLPHHPTISQGLQYMITTNVQDLATVPMRMTASMIVLLPILILFTAFQKRLVGNLTFGAEKG